MQGKRFCSAISCARRCFFTVSGKYVPPLTVASFATITHSRPSTTPMPVTIPAAGACPSYSPQAAGGESSRKAVSGSTRRSTRSRAVSFPRDRCRSVASGPPPRATSVVRSRNSATRASIRSRRRSKTSPSRSTCEVRIAIRRSLAGQFVVSEAGHHMVVDHAGRLHERVADRRPDEAEAAPFQVLAHRLRLGRLGRDLGEGPPGVDDRLSAHERPEMRVQAAELQRCPGIPDRRRDLRAVADDRRVCEKPLDVALVESGHALRIEAGERAAIALALAEDRRPGEPGLCALEHEQLEKMTLVVGGDAPFLVVVGDVKGVTL